MKTELRIVHFNDVYHVPSLDLLSRFTQIQQSFLGRDKTNGLTIFSGDGFSPSLEASVLKGEHMGPVLDFVGVDLGCYGNHDFDFGDSRLIELSKGVRFPWVLSNAFHKSSGTEGSDGRGLLGCAEEYIIRTIDGVKIGFFGLAGTDWPSNCENLPPSVIASPAEVAQRLAKHLRTHEHCDVVIALTHMRLAEDMQVADATLVGESRVDLLLGGHDHDVSRRFAGDSDTRSGIIQQGQENEDIILKGVVPATNSDLRIVKSGTDWRSLSLVQMTIDKRDDGSVAVSTELTQYIDTKVAVDAAAPPNGAEEILSKIHDRVGIIVQEPVLHTTVPLDGRSTVLRSQETNLGNMLADAVRAFYNTDIAFFNSGAIRCDSILGPTVPGGQPLLVRDIINICPFENSFVVKRISGKILHLALENSIGDMHSDGRFFQVSGLRITATWEREQGNRIVEVLRESQSKRREKLDPERMYTVALSGFISEGFDGYTWFPGEETLVGEEAAMTDTGLMLQIFGHGQTVEGNDTHVQGIERAREVTISGRTDDGFPVVSPVVDRRIHFVGRPNVCDLN